MVTDAGVLQGLRVVEIADEQAAHTGLSLASLGASVVKVEPPAGSATRRIGPFFGNGPDPEKSVFFWQHNRGKQSIVADPASPADVATLRALIARADVLLVSGSDYEVYAALPEFGKDALLAANPRLVFARMTPFGDDGPWAGFRANDLVHLALGGPVMNCGYDPRPDGFYDLPPIAPAQWHSYLIAGEQLLIGVLAAVLHQSRTGEGQYLSCAVHEAVAKSTELDLMNWVMRRSPLNRQTCRHAAEKVSAVVTLAQTKDGRYLITVPMGAKNEAQIIDFLAARGVVSDLGEGAADTGTRDIPGSNAVGERTTRVLELVERFVRKHSYETLPWLEMQDAGIVCSPIRLPHENALDPHWRARGTFAEVEHPELGRSFTYAVSKWVSTGPDFVPGRRAPLLGEDTEAIKATLATPSAPALTAPRYPAPVPAPLSVHQRPMPLSGVRIFDFSWFLASAGGTRFLAALGAEVIKVEWKANPDTRMAAMAPEGGRAAREAAVAPLRGVSDPDMGGQFNNKNPGKRGLSLNVRHPEGLAIAKRLIAMSDIVAEGFSPGVLDRWGLGWDELRKIKPDIIYAQQSGMGTAGTYGRLRAVGPIAGALAGVTEMSGLPNPAMPAGWGYSYLDWIGAYSFSTAMLSALLHRERTGEGQWIDASQTESGIFVAGGAILEWSALGRAWSRTGNHSPQRSAAPHAIYRTAGDDRWIAIACTTTAEWQALAALIDEDWTAEFPTLESRLDCQDILDHHVEAWTRTQDGYALMARLQAHGVPAGVCQTAGDRVEQDPQLAHLRWLTEVEGTKIGRWPLAEFPVKLAATPAHIGGAVNRGAPCYGEDNEWVLGELLGMDKRRIARLADDGVI
ncbi:CoA transferase [Amycolatopsis sp. FDAARGOS 1241]|uniref:CaiB/BaiF CoA-transferase family protein n=1 Tax=Amycolatopsis sp. FDAARGOS 1241 TaxID=2778070 RepID=UPI00194F0271|nr:CoA transferase [Amycolatopsis sp. FDAARGOS 1241]QRP42862.1 CoA transferase [Amycolatopsis sp. FDAARGOS 1241]